MPFARISVLRGRSAGDLAALADNVHLAMVEAFDVPRDDRFQIIHQHEPGELIYDSHYLGGPRSDAFVLVHITAGKPRCTATKRAFYRRLVDLLYEAQGIDPEDVMVVINTTKGEDWSFGGGRMSMVASPQGVTS